MLQQDMQGQNIQEPLLWMRGGSAMYKRRGGWKYVKSQYALLRYMYATGFIGLASFLISAFIRTVAAIVPNALRAVLFQRAMRTKKQDESA